MRNPVLASALILSGLVMGGVGAPLIAQPAPSVVQTVPLPESAVAAGVTPPPEEAGPAVENERPPLFPDGLPGRAAAPPPAAALPDPDAEALAAQRRVMELNQQQRASIDATAERQRAVDERYQAEMQAAAAARAAYETELFARERQHAEAMAAWERRAAACRAGDVTQCAPPPVLPGP